MTTVSATVCLERTDWSTVCLEMTDWCTVRLERTDRCTVFLEKTDWSTVCLARNASRDDRMVYSLRDNQVTERLAERHRPNKNMQISITDGCR